MSITLISAVGTTDPIRNFHDGPLLHISRVYRPNKIVLIFSEELYHKREKVERAINSIRDYHPEIIVAEEVLSNEDVFRFDEMFNQMSEIVKKYVVEDEELILNLSSATPQIISAMFAINRINDYNVKAVQVATPERSSNENVGYGNEEDFDSLIDTNIDNQEEFENRTIEDKSEKFSQALLKRNLRSLIEKYDYQAARDILENSKKISNRKELFKLLNKIVLDIQTQAIPEKISKRLSNDQAARALNAFILLDLQDKRGNIAECLIRIKSLAEFIVEQYLNKHYPEIIVYDEDNKPYPNDETVEYFKEQFQQEGREYHKSYLSLPAYIDILKRYNEKEILSKLYKIREINKVRNLVAHSLYSFDQKEIKKFREALRAVKELLDETYHFEKWAFEYYNNLNNNLLELLQ